MVLHLLPNLELLLVRTLQIASNLGRTADGLVFTCTIVVILLLAGVAFKLEPVEVSARRKARSFRNEIVFTAAGTITAFFSPRVEAGQAKDSFASFASLSIPSNILANQTLIQVVEGSPDHSARLESNFSFGRRRESLSHLCKHFHIRIHRAAALYHNLF